MGLSQWNIITRGAQLARLATQPVGPDYLTEHFAILGPQNPWISEMFVVRKRRLVDFEAVKCSDG